MLIPPVGHAQLDPPDMLRADESTPVTVNRFVTLDNRNQPRDNFASFGVLSGSNYEYGGTMAQVSCLTLSH